MKGPSVKPVRCAIYTRVSTEHGLDQEFNSLDAQYDAASAYIKSQAHAGWTLIRSRYDDGGYSGGLRCAQVSEIDQIFWEGRPGYEGRRERPPSAFMAAGASVL